MFLQLLARRALTLWALIGLCLGWCAAQGQPATGDVSAPPLYFVRAPQAVAIDGKLNDWILTAPVSYEVDANAQDRAVQSYGMWDDQYVYLAYVVQDASPMKNAGDDPSFAFKTGDSLHFYLSTSAELTAPTRTGGPQDYHVLMSVLHGTPTIFAFREKKAGVTKPTHIATPVQGIDIDWMGPVPGAELSVVVGRDGKSYVAEAKLPLAFFDNFHPQAGQKVATDMAVNFSDAVGSTNMAKVWWHRGATQILDVPSELRFDRNLWGTGVFAAPGETPIIINRKNAYVPPTPGPITLDGDLKDWDLSCAYGPQYVDVALKDKSNVTWAMMYDAQYLYLGAIFNSPTAYSNGSGIDNKWWEGDSLEFRLNTDTKNQDGNVKENDDILTFGVWHNPTENKDYIALQRSFKFTISDISSATVRSKATPTGRTFEVRIPWSVVQSGNYPKAGDAISCTLAAIWANGPRAYGMGSISSFRGVNDWGKANFLAKGNQPLVYRTFYDQVIAETPINAGQYKTTLTVPEKGLLSAGVYDKEGRLLRTLFAGRTVETGPVEIGWDGKDDLGKALPAGQYQVRAIINSGLRAQYATGATSPGKPPYASTDQKRGWGGVWDNVRDITSDSTGVYPLWGVEEGDGGLLKMDVDGNYLWRQHHPLALSGTNVAVTSNGKYVYCGVDISGGESTENHGKAGLWRVNCSDGGYVAFPHENSNPLEFYLDGIQRPTTATDAQGNKLKLPSITGLAADATTIYASAYYQDAIACYDAETGKPVRTISVLRPRGLCLDGAGTLLVVSDRQVLRVDLKTGKSTPVITSGLVAPWDVAIDAKGMLLVTDQGASMQIKRFDRKGKLIGTYGARGGRTNNGKYDTNHLLNPAGVTAMGGKIFFCEDTEPRIIMRLSAAMKYEKIWAGSWYISGEVTVDPQDPTHVYSWGGSAFVRHRIDYDKKTSVPDAVWTDFALPNGQYGRWFPRIINHAGKKYIFCSGTNETLYRIDGDKMLIIAAVGVTRVNNKPTVWTFTDLNQNGVIDPGEKLPYTPTSKELAYSGSYWSGSIDERDLTMYVMNGESNVIALTPTFAAPGVPVYRFETARVIPLAAANKPNAKDHLSSVWYTPDGGVLGNADADGSDPRGIGHSSHLSDVFAYRLDKDGNLIWRAGKKASGVAKNGEFYGRACGLGGYITNDYFDFVDEGGQDKVYSTDGLFVGNLLDDTATAVPSEYTLFVEHFSSTTFQNAQNGRWYFVAGASGYASIWEIVGLDKVKRLQGSFEVK